MSVFYKWLETLRPLWTQNWHCLFWDSCLQNKECLCHEPEQEKRGRKSFRRKWTTYILFGIFENLEDTIKKSLTKQWSYWKCFPSSLHLQNKLIRKLWFVYLQYRDQESIVSLANCRFGSSGREQPKPSPVLLLHKRWCTEHFWRIQLLLHSIRYDFSCFLLPAKWINATGPKLKKNKQPNRGLFKQLLKGTIFNPYEWKMNPFSFCIWCLV